MNKPRGSSPGTHAIKGDWLFWPFFFGLIAIAVAGTFRVVIEPAGRCAEATPAVTQNPFLQTKEKTP